MVARRPITGEVAKRSIDREQWSSLNRQRVDLLLKGRGEGYVEELYFGKGFSNPPTFNFSAVVDPGGEDVLPWFVVGPRNSIKTNLDVYGMGNDSLSECGTMLDPGFERQGKYRVHGEEMAAFIPFFSELNEATLYAYYIPPYDYMVHALPIAKYLHDNHVALTAANDYRYGDPGSLWHNNGWAQDGNTRDRWALTFSDSHDLGIGEAGQASAEATIGSSRHTPRLCPLLNDHYESWVGYPAVSLSHPELAWLVWPSFMEYPVGTYYTFGGPDGRSGIVPPPYPAGFRGFGYAKTSADAVLHVRRQTRAKVYMSTSDVLATGLGDPLLHYTETFDEGTFKGNEWLFIDLGEDAFSVPIRAGDWAKFDIEFLKTWWAGYPSVSVCLDLEGLPDQEIFHTISFTFEGEPGTVVRLDNVFMDRVFLNEALPKLTIGVDEWIRDESGVYIGAKLWINMGTPAPDNCLPTRGGSDAS